MGNNTTGAGLNTSAQQKSAPKGLYLGLTLLKQGVDTMVPATTTLTIGGQTVTQPSLSSELGNDIAVFSAVFEKHAEYQAAVATRKAALQDLKTQYAQFVKAIEGQFPPGDPILQKFGIHPRKKPAPLTAEQKAVKAAKAKLTRQKRHTMGPKEKLGIQTIGTPLVTIQPDGTTTAVPPTLLEPGSSAGTSQPSGSGGSTDASGGTSGK